MTFFAGDTGVFALERVAAESVIEFLRGGFPVHDVEILTVVLEVAANAVLAGGIAHLNLKMVAVLGGEGLGDFFMTIKALEDGSAAAELVTRAALRGAG